MNLQDFITATKKSVTLLTLHTSFFYCCTIANRGCILPFIHSTIPMGCLHPFCNTTSFSEINAFTQWSILQEQRLWICDYYKRVDKNNLFFQRFLMPLVCAMVLSFTFRQVIKLKSVWPTAKTTVIFIGPISIMIHLAVYTCPMDTYSSKMY